MALPITTTTFTIHRLKVLDGPVVTDRDPYGEGYDGAGDGPGPQNTAAYDDIAHGVRGVVGGPAGSEKDIGGSQEQVTWQIHFDPCDITHDDEVTDELTGIRYRMVWVAPRRGLGLDHMVGGARTVTGGAP